MGSIKFYILTKTQAETIGKFEYEPGKVFDPFITDGNGNYFVSDEMYLLLKDNENLQKVDFTQLQTTTKIEFKNTLI